MRVTSGYISCETSFQRGESTRLRSESTPEQPPGRRLGHVDVVDRLGLFGHPPELLQRLVGRQVRRDRHEVRRHDAGRALGRVGQQVADVLGLLVLHLVEDRLGLARVELAHDVGRVVGVHLFEDVGGLGPAELAEQPGSVERVELGDASRRAPRRRGG